jgi:hypothetical protein
MFAALAVAAVFRFLAPGTRSSWIPPVPKTAGRQFGISSGHPCTQKQERPSWPRIQQEAALNDALKERRKRKRPAEAGLVRPPTDAMAGP